MAWKTKPPKSSQPASGLAKSMPGSDNWGACEPRPVGRSHQAADNSHNSVIFDSLP